MNSSPHLSQRFLFSVKQNALDSLAFFLIASNLVNIFELSERLISEIKVFLFIYSLCSKYFKKWLFNLNMLEMKTL